MKMVLLCALAATTLPWLILLRGNSAACATTTKLPGVLSIVIDVTRVCAGLLVVFTAAKYPEGQAGSAISPFGGIRLDYIFVYHTIQNFLRYALVADYEARVLLAI